MPPLDYDRVYRLKARLPHKFIGINGGIHSLGETKAHLEHVDGVMMGRSAYHDPQILLGVDSLIYGDTDRKSTRLNSSHRNTSRMPSSA